MKSIANVSVFIAALAVTVPFASASTLIEGAINTSGWAASSSSTNMFTVSSTGAAQLVLPGNNTGVVTGPPATGGFAAFYPSGIVTDYSFSTATILPSTPTEILSLADTTDTVAFFATSVGSFSPTDLSATQGNLVLYGYLSATGPNFISNQEAVLDIAANGIGNNFTADLTAAAPEPSSLVLLGTGLFGTAGAMLRRLRRS